MQRGIISVWPSRWSLFQKLWNLSSMFALFSCFDAT